MFNHRVIEQADASTNLGLMRVVFLWAVLVLLGYGSMVFYSTAPAKSAVTVGKYPSSSSLSKGDGLTLIIFLHPQCPCSIATVSELEGLLARSSLSSRLKVYAVVSSPVGCSQTFVKGAVIDSLSAVKNVQVFIDNDDVESQRFGAKTSGQTLLFDSDGKCLFRGGITAARGEVGANAGVDALRHYLSGGRYLINKTPVFGCSLESSK
ncbi:hypothetical protein KBI23_20155 [bacterium]|nr:hypothetical protein [bacterium]MBP9806676.1 hypothetical protein [bacterium]